MERFNNQILVLPFFSPVGLKVRIWYRNWDNLNYFAKKWNSNRKTSFRICDRWAEIFIGFQWFSDIFSNVRKQCSVTFSNNQRFSVLIIAISPLRFSEFVLCNNTDQGSFSSETATSIEIHAMQINYQFWNILKNPFKSLNQRGVSMIIANSSRDVNAGWVTETWWHNTFWWREKNALDSTWISLVFPWIFYQWNRLISILQWLKLLTSDESIQIDRQ